jgi:uncharacterized protein YjbI with pentapeptide repeats
MTGDELLELYINGERNFKGADFRGADLRRANLQNADLKFSCLPLWCGGTGLKIDRAIATQFAYHFCAQKCDDPDYVMARNAVLDFANSFSLVKEKSVAQLESQSVKEGG